MQQTIKIAKTLQNCDIMQQTIYIINFYILYELIHKLLHKLYNNSYTL